MKSCPKGTVFAVVNQNGRLYFGGHKFARPYGSGWTGAGGCVTFGWEQTSVYLDSSTYPDGCIIMKPIIQ